MNNGIYSLVEANGRKMEGGLFLAFPLTAVGRVGGASVWLLSLVGVCTTGPSTKMRPSSLGNSEAHFGAKVGKRQSLQSQTNLAMFGESAGKDSGRGLYLIWNPLARSWSFPLSS